MTTKKILVGAFVLFASVSGRTVAQESWVGQSVMPIKNEKDIQFGDWINGRQVYFPFKTVRPIIVRADREGWLRVSNGERDGWVDKADFMLSRNGSVTINLPPVQLPTLEIRAVVANPKGQYAVYTPGGTMIYQGELNQEVNEAIQSGFREVVRTLFIPPFGRRLR